MAEDEGEELTALALSARLDPLLPRILTSRAKAGGFGEIAWDVEEGGL